MTEVLEGDYRGQPMLIMRQNETDRFPFQFGLRKARLILEHLDDIEEFVVKHTKA